MDKNFDGGGVDNYNIWVGDCFIYTNSVNRLNYYVGGEIVQWHI